MNERQIRKFLLSLLNTLTLIPKDVRQNLRLTRKAKNQDEFRLNWFLDSIEIIETDFLISQNCDNSNIVPFPGNNN